MRKLTRALFLAGAIGMPTTALADEAPANTFSGNIGVVSDYVFRGLTQSWGDPALQGGLDYAHASGFFAGTWASSISDKEYNNTNMEWDFYAGYNGKIDDDMGWGVGAIQVWYPGGYYDAMGTPGYGRQRYDTQELNASFTYKSLSLKYSHALTNLFGLSDKNYFSALDTSGETIPGGNTKGSGYLEANVTHEIMDKLTLGLHVGHQWVKNASHYDYTDYKISLNKELPEEMFGLNVGLAYSDTNARKEAWSALAPSGGATRLLGDGAWVLSVGKIF